MIEKPPLKMSKHARNHEIASDDAPAKRRRSNNEPGSKRNHVSRQKREPGTKSDSHFRGLYASDPEFSQLGRDDPEFGSMYVAIDHKRGHGSKFSMSLTGKRQHPKWYL